MVLNRRKFFLLSAGLAAGCSSMPDEGLPPARGERVIPAGPAGGYAADGVYPRFHDQGFFIIRQGQTLFALSAICTHRKCKLIAEPDNSFYCKCHGSTFDPAGRVTRGPARRDLPVLPTFTDQHGQLLVKVPA
jgi:Rieske Fe-S protein